MSQIVSTVAPYVVTLLGTVLCLLLSRLTSVATSKLKDQRAVTFLERLDHLAEDVVLEAQQVSVDKIKAASIDGKLDRATADGIRAEVLAKLKQHLTPDGVKAAMQALGLPDEAALDALLKTKVEAWVASLKDSTPGTTVSNTTVNIKPPAAG